MTTEQKIIGGIGVTTLIILVGAIMLFTRKSEQSVPKEQIVAESGIHWHPKLSVYINGEKQDLSENIGLGAVHGKLHTHEQDAKDGVVHMEMQGVVTKDDTKLGAFFKAWGKDFTATKLFDKTNGPEGTVKVLVNGKPNTEFENYLMKEGDTIEVRYE